MTRPAEDLAHEQRLVDGLVMDRDVVGRRLAILEEELERAAGRHGEVLAVEGNALGRDDGPAGRARGGEPPAPVVFVQATSKARGEARRPILAVTADPGRPAGQPLARQGVAPD